MYIQGITKLLLIRIPHFREVLIESFDCPHCHHSNKSVKSAGAIQPLGSKYVLKLENEEDFERAIVKSETCQFRIQDLELDMPVGQGQYTNVEGMLTHILDDLKKDQSERKETQPELHAALEGIIRQLVKMKEGFTFPFTISLDDPTGNSWIEFSPKDAKGKYDRKDYRRTEEQNAALGLGTAEDEAENPGEAANPLDGVDIIDGQVYEFHEQCPACASSCTVNMQKVEIPHFKDVIIMSTVCEACGYRTSDVKTGGAIPERGVRITVLIKDIEDLKRDILKSETCALRSPELGLDVQPGTLGGRFTTVEGLLAQVRDQLHGQIFDVEDTDANDPTKVMKGGDSMDNNTKLAWAGFFERLDKAIDARIQFTIVLEDPLANSYVEQLVPNDEQDPQVQQEEYERTEEEMEDLGLNDMQTQGYEDGVEP